VPKSVKFRCYYGKAITTGQLQMTVTNSWISEQPLPAALSSNQPVELDCSVMFGQSNSALQLTDGDVVVLVSLYYVVAASKDNLCSVCS